MRNSYIIGIIVIIVVGILSVFLFNNLSGSKTQAPSEPPPKEPEVTELISVGGFTGEAIATRVYDRGSFVHTITTKNVPDPASGKFYEGWLVKKEPKLTFISTGELEKEGENYKLTYNVSTDYFDYSDVVVTEETEANGLDGKPETHILEGTF
jgi:uncharacterized SAM-binding protein YcdF (DUF218 family)